MNIEIQRSGKMSREINGKKAWMGTLSEHWGPKNETDVKIEEKRTMEKWRNLHYYGRTKIVDTMINIQDDDVMLDIGCSSGERLARFENECALTIGIDISDSYCNASKINSPRSLTVRGDIEKLPFADACIDVCSIVYTFVYMQNQPKVMGEIQRVLKKGGRLIVFDPNSLSIRTFLRKLQIVKHKISGKDDSPSDINRLLVTTQSLNIFEFKKMAYNAGLECRSWRGNFDTVPFPMIGEGVFGYLTLFLFWLWAKLGCRRWGNVPLMRCFSDFLIIEFVKGDQDV